MSQFRRTAKRLARNGWSDCLVVYEDKLRELQEAQFAATEQRALWLGDLRTRMGHRHRTLTRKRAARANRAWCLMLDVNLKPRAIPEDADLWPEARI